MKLLRPLLLLAMACADPSTDVDLPPEWCEGSTAHRYAPHLESDLLQFPDDLLLVEDVTSPTGLRLDPSDARIPWLADLPPAIQNMLAGLHTLDGFGRSAAILLRFTGDLGEIPAPEHLRLIDLDAGVEIPSIAVVEDLGRQLRVQPLRTLAPGHLHGLVLTTGHRDADDACVRPGPTLRALLTGTAPDPMMEHLPDRYRALLRTAALRADEVSAATVFTTHNDITVMAEVAEDVKNRPYTWADAPICGEPDRGVIRCEGSFDAMDYREGDDILTGAAQQPWRIPVSVWLPADAPGPHPTLIYGHGLASSRNEGRVHARNLADLGLAVVATDALRHNEHPTSAGDGFTAGTAFLGIDLSQGAINGMQLRGNFRQTGVDRLQLIELLHRAPDITGDGTADLDTARLGYLGVSLGGLLGPVLLALSDDLHLAALPVGGGHLTTFATDTEATALIRPLLEGLLGGPEVFSRVLLVAQALVDVADPATFAAHVLTDRVGSPEGAPHLLLPVAQDDDTVPPSTGEFLARGLGLPHVQPVAWPVPGLDEVVPAPALLNAEGRTAGYFQLDRITRGDGVGLATHGSTPTSAEGLAQLRHFYQTWLDDGAPEILDPYALLSTPPRDEIP